ncbi:methyltransferase regulatory domain-containing protein [Pseudoduganella ginsengisoli]|uniref:Methyltransferase domain-containing protein n=1 Tax=Pseudoduganella ginsengisoli TaxID=1462440 RepID=A0A6L6PUY2_9BURK|nr:class I SAM-dependent methyltransferase [Pseudoduganella ginsengisoli]MTW00798.1 methyltransferase domain-containing protein [Pseudoduganella ginsengisoli]
MSWTGGYVSDIEYTGGYYSEQNPVLLNFAALLEGFEPVAAGQEYTYFELGFGKGHTVNLLASANPLGRFYAADFNPAHVAGARALAQAAQLPNVTLLENSFAELAQGAVELPQFDYITLHGIYTWVTRENQQCIVDFIARYLKPGGIVYVSYNAMPGWSSVQPLQRLLVEYGDAFPNRSDVQVSHGAEFIKKLVATDAAYFQGGGTLQVRLKGLNSHHPNYLVHEYMHKHWQPMYHADVARDFSEAKLDYVASADLPMAYNKLYLNDEKQALVDTFPNSAMKETMKDYYLNTSFRKDIYVRGARHLPSLRRAAMLREFGLALIIPRDDVKLDLSLGIGNISAKPELALPLCDALSRRPHTLAELEALPALQGRNLEDIVQLAALLTASRQTVLYHSRHETLPTDAVQRMNVAIAADTRYGDECHFMASALTGGAITVGFLSRLAYWLLAGERMEAEPRALAQAGWPILKAQGRVMVRDGNKLTEDSDNVAELQARMETIVREEVPIWRKLKML